MSKNSLHTMDEKLEGKVKKLLDLGVGDKGRLDFILS